MATLDGIFDDEQARTLTTDVIPERMSLPLGAGLCMWLGWTGPCVPVSRNTALLTAVIPTTDRLARI